MATPRRRRRPPKRTQAAKKPVAGTGRWLSVAAGAKELVGLPGLVALAGLAVQRSDRFVFPAELLDPAPLAGTGLLIALALVLRQGRTLLAGLLLGVLAAGTLSAAALTRTLLPIALSGVALLAPRHPLRRRSAMALAGLGVGGWAVTVGPLSGPGGSLLGDLAESMAPLPISVLAGALAALPLGIRLLQRPSPLIRGALWSLLPLSAALASDAPSPVLLVSVAGLWILGALGEAHFLSFRDALTRLPGRRAFDRELAELGRRFVIAMVDVDHFKRINDRHGHDVGDQVLARIASRIARVRGGRAFRYGGEEFAIVFRGRSLPDCREHLEDLLQRVADEPFGVRETDRRLRVTVSIGAAERGARYANVEEVIAAADRALYRAKKSGRNRLTVAPQRRR